jgi:hypothetical protein
MTTSKGLFDWLNDAPPEQRARILILIGFNLTVVARDCPTDDKTARLRLAGINELQHRILSRACEYLSGSSKNYPLESFCSNLFSMAENKSLTAALSDTLNFARKVKLS